MEKKMNVLETEIESWDHYAYALREENRLLFQEMLDKCLKSKYFESVNSKGKNYSAESLFLILILEQQKMINKLLERLGDKTNAKGDYDSGEDEGSTSKQKSLNDSE